MPSVYLYLSTAKLDQLLTQEPGFLAGVTANLDFKLPFVDGGLSSTSTKSSIARLKDLERKLQKEYSPPQHHEIPPGSAPVFIRFKGRAVRAIRRSEFWLALDHPETPLLLAGSASFVLGERASGRGELFSPSGDPVGAFLSAFKQSNPKVANPSVADSISYIWQCLVAEPIRSHENLPIVEGLAIYATTAQAFGDFHRVRRPKVREIVVGTPLFVRQVQEQPAVLDADATLVEMRKRFLVQVSTVHDLNRADRYQGTIQALVYKLHCVGYRVADGRGYGSGFYLSEYRRVGRWDRAFVLYKAGKRELAEHIQSIVTGEGQLTCDTVEIEEAVVANGECNMNLIADGADISVLVCSD